MGRVGAAGDNAAMESFFALLQKNVLDRQVRSARQELRNAIVTWIEHTYHHRRRQTRLTPVEYETIMTPPAAHAACTPLSPDHAAVPALPCGRRRLTRTATGHRRRGRPTA
nr:IS3 family transposase [Streptomyces polyasparticus]